MKRHCRYPQFVQIFRFWFFLEFLDPGSIFSTWVVLDYSAVPTPKSNKING
ncbi:MAG: hypothetical protein ACYCYP_10885 [Leptospirales bacterium]